MLNVVIISPGFPVNEDDSVCLPFLQLILKQFLKTKQVKLTVITEQYPMSDNYVWNGVPVITLRKKENVLYYKLRRYSRLKKALKKLNAAQKIDVIHNFWFSDSALIADKFAFAYGIKHITSFSGQDVLPTNKALSQLDSYKGQIVCASHFHRIKLSESTQRACKVVGFGIEDFENPVVEKDIDLIFCGWISDLKNYNQFIEIVAGLNKMQTLSKVVICGGGQGLALLNEKINSLNLAHLVETTGEIPREKVMAYMRRTKVLVHTSEFESFGLVLAEALSLGCQVVSKPVGIAYDDPKILTCTSTEEFISKVASCLKTGNKGIPAKTEYPVSLTVGNYLEIYKA